MSNFVLNRTENIVDKGEKLQKPVAAFPITIVETKVSGNRAMYHNAMITINPRKEI